MDMNSLSPSESLRIYLFHRCLRPAAAWVVTLCVVVCGGPARCGTRRMADAAAAEQPRGRLPGVDDRRSGYRSRYGPVGSPGREAGPHIGRRHPDPRVVTRALREHVDEQLADRDESHVGEATRRGRRTGG